MKSGFSLEFISEIERVGRTGDQGWTEWIVRLWVGERRGCGARLVEGVIGLWVVGGGGGRSGGGRGERVIGTGCDSRV